MHMVKFPNPLLKVFDFSLIGWSGLCILTRMSTAITHFAPKDTVNRVYMMVCEVPQECNCTCSSYLKPLAFSLRLDELLHLRIHRLFLGSQSSESIMTVNIFLHFRKCSADRCIHSTHSQFWILNRSSLGSMTLFQPLLLGSLLHNLGHGHRDLPRLQSLQLAEFPQQILAREHLQAGGSGERTLRVEPQVDRDNINCLLHPVVSI